MLFDLQIFSGGVYPPSANSHTISFLFPIVLVLWSSCSSKLCIARRLLAAFFTIATSPGHVCAHARGPRSDRDPGSSRETCLYLNDRQFEL